MVNKAGVTSLLLPVQRLVILLPGADQPREMVESLEKDQEEQVQGGREGDEQGLRVEVAEEGEEIIDL